MKITRIIAAGMVIAGVSSSFLANAKTTSCATGWTRKATLFESAIQYDDMHSKANPTVQVLINGKAVKMMLDTSARMSGLWDMSLLKEMHDTDTQKLGAHVALDDAQRVNAILEDDHGHAARQEFVLISDSILAADGYAGVLSPQSIAGDNAVVIDLENNCFFTSTPFDIGSVTGFDVYRGTATEGVDGFLKTTVEVDNRDIPLVVNSGASITSISTALLDSKPKGPESPRLTDMFGTEIPVKTSTRLVDLKINGQTFKSQPVVQIEKTDNEGAGGYGSIGMDILKDRVIYLDGTQHEFILLTKKRAL